MKLFKRFPFLWFLVFLLVALTVFQQVRSLDRRVTQVSFFQFLERHLEVFKQKNNFSIKLENTNDLKILEPQLKRKSFVWLEDSFRKDLAKSLESYEGPILLNLDPELSLKDPYLSKLFKKKNVIRSFSFDYSAPSSEDLSVEVKVGSQIQQPPLGLLSSQIRLNPSDLSYYQGGAAGSLVFIQDEKSVSAQFLGTYPLALRAAKYYLPTVLLAAYQFHQPCQKWAMPTAQNLICAESNQEFLNPLPIHFYAKSFKRIRKPSDLKNSQALLIVNPVDSSSYFPSALGEKITWSDLVGTAYLNMIHGHSPIRNSSSVVFEVFLLLFCLGISISSSLFGKSRTVLVGIFASLAIFVLGDFIFYVGFGWLTKPIEGGFCLFSVGVILFGGRSVVDYEERSLLDKALSGYVSQERLSRLMSGKEKLNLIGKMRAMSTLLLDISKFSKISQELGPEKTFEFVQRFFAVIDPLVFENGGTIDKKTGDGLLAFFGDYEGEDQLERAAKEAVHAALAIQARLAELPEFKDVKVRIGVNCGEMMIGNTGSASHFNYTVLGESVNFTQRLEAACPEGMVLVGREVADYTKDFFSFEEKRIQVKNEDEQYTAFLVLKRNA